MFCYRPQTKFAKVMFLHLSVSHSVHRGCLPQCMLGYIHPQADTPSQEQTTTRSRHPLRSRYPLGADTPQEQTPPGSRHPPRADTAREQTPPPGADTPPSQCMLWDTGNKRAVRILLECILVDNLFSFVVDFVNVGSSHCQFNCGSSYRQGKRMGKKGFSWQASVARLGWATQLRHHRFTIWTSTGGTWSSK